MLRLRTIAVFLILGAIVNVAVAWGCARWADIHGRHATNEGHLRWSTGVPQDWPEAPNWIWTDWSPGIHQCIAQAHGPTDSEGNLNPTLYRLVTHRVGWPLYSMRWDLHGMRKDSRGTLDWWPNESDIENRWITGLSISPKMDFTDVVLFYRHWPLRPIAAGFAVNAAFYAVLIWIVCSIPFAARRLIRRRRGECERCAYPIGASAVCTECGAAVTR